MNESEPAIHAVNQATEVLRNYYDNNAFIQTKIPSELKPQISSYQADTERNGGILEILGTVKNDLEIAKANAEGAIEQLRAAHKTLEAKQQAAINDANDGLRSGAEAAAELKRNIQIMSKSLRLQKDQLEKIQTYETELQPICVTKHVSYEERVAKRQKEVDALKQAYEILDSKA